MGFTWIIHLIFQVLYNYYPYFKEEETDPERLFVQGHTASRQQRLDSKVTILVPGAMLLTLNYVLQSPKHGKEGGGGKKKGVQ